MGTDQTSVAFLETKQIRPFSGGFKLQDLLPDIFETGQHFNQADIISFCNGVSQIGGHDSFDQESVIRQAVSAFLCPIS